MTDGMKGYKEPLNSFVAVDVETTGLSVKKEQIIEIGAVRYADGAEVERYSTFVRNEKRIPDRITELTGITGEMLKDAPSEAEAVKGLLYFIGADVILGHNIAFDFSFIRLAAARFGTDFLAYGIDTLKIARKVLPDIPGRSLGELCDYYNIRNEAAHRACSDARAAAEVYFRMRAGFPDDRELFLPYRLEYRIKKQEPAMEKQKKYLNDLLIYHKINLNINWENLTKSEASRRIDTIIREYGLPQYRNR